jgi:small GTP-binding protein
MADNLFNEILKRFPSDVQDGVRLVWETLGPEERESLTALFSSFPNQTNLRRLLISLSASQIRQTFGQKHRVAIVGPANVGKSTLYNQFVHNSQDLAEVGPYPGTTKTNQQGDADLFTIVDTPGMDAVGDLGERERLLALAAAQEADFLVVVFDAIQGIKKTDQELFNELAALKKPFLVVLNKIDLVSPRDLETVQAMAARNLGLKPDQIISVVAKDGKHLSKVLLAIAAAEPRLVAALGQAMPEYRWQLAWRSIISAASISGTIALIPMPMIDFIPLVATQAVMVLGIARIYDYRITPQRSTELVTAFGMGFLGRTLFQQLSKLGGIPGWLLSAAIAASTTVVMGYASILWFERGEKLSNEALKNLTQELTTHLIASLKDLSKPKPGDKNLQQRIAELIEKLPLARRESNG